MEKLKLNETPIRTSRNFNINNITLDDVQIPEKIGSFNNINIIGQHPNIKLTKHTEAYHLTYGVGEKLISEIEKQANQKLGLIINTKTHQEMQVNYMLNKDNTQLVDHIEIQANENTNATIIIQYETQKEIKAFHNGVINVQAKKGSNINIILVNFINLQSNHFMSIENNIEENANLTYTIIDFGGKNSITNYYSKIEGEQAKNKLNTIYLGKENQVFDFNYIGELKGKKSDINIQVEGALKDTAKKHFKGTIDFKKGCKKATGNEIENCMLLSDTAKSIALPMLLCSEEEVEGNHATSAGKIGEKELFYLMSRGIEKKEAMKLMVRARFHKIIETIENEELKQKILNEIDERLD